MGKKEKKMTKIITTAIKDAKAEWDSNVDSLGFQISKDNTTLIGGKKEGGTAVAGTIDAPNGNTNVAAGDESAEFTTAANHSFVVGDHVFTEAGAYIGEITNKSAATKFKVTNKTAVQVTIAKNDKLHRRAAAPTGYVKKYELKDNALTEKQSIVVDPKDSTNAGFGTAFTLSDDGNRLFISDNNKVYQYFKQDDGTFAEKATPFRISEAGVVNIAYDDNYLALGTNGTISVYNVTPSSDTAANAVLHAQKLTKADYGDHELILRNDLGIIIANTDKVALSDTNVNTDGDVALVKGSSVNVTAGADVTSGAKALKVGDLISSDNTDGNIKGTVTALNVGGDNKVFSLRAAVTETWTSGGDIFKSTRRPLVIKLNDQDNQNVALAEPTALLTPSNVVGADYIQPGYGNGPKGIALGEGANPYLAITHPEGEKKMVRLVLVLFFNGTLNQKHLEVYL